MIEKSDRPIAKVPAVLKRLWKIVKAVLSRCIFALFCFIAIWRVTEALDNNNYWLLLLALSPLAVETLHAITSKQTNQFKWLTPNVLFFLLCAIPCIWLLELKLLQDRLMEAEEAVEATPETTTAGDNMTTTLLTTTSQNIININASDSDWTLALEQLLIFALVLAKWISPKGKLTLNELSQLLLVNIAAGADILELMETFGEEQVQLNSDIVYMIMSAWSWSLLQFTIVLTSAKSLPELSDDDEEEAMMQNGSVVTKANDNANTQNATNQSASNYSVKDSGESSSCHNQITSNGNISTADTSQANGIAGIHNPKSESEIINISDETAPTDKGKVHDKLRADEEVNAFLEGRRCFDCFCCYNEIWGMSMSIFFQDGPFFILRMVILFHYGVITHMNIFFTGKNIFVIILLLNRIRVVVKEERKPWREHMAKVKKQRRRQKDKSRKERGLPLKTKPKSTSGTRQPKPRKPRWLIWRS